MNNATMVWLGVIAAAILTIAMAIRFRSRDILLFISLYFVFSAFGPVVNYLLGNGIYAGTVADKIGLAAMGFALALVGIAAVGLAFPSNGHALDRSRLDNLDRTFPVIPVILLSLTTFTIAVLVISAPHLSSGSKLARIAAVGQWHEKYLTLEIFACSLYFIATRTAVGRVMYWANMASYIFYCLATDERDFLFVLFALMLHLQLFHRRSMITRLGLVAASFAVAATLLVDLRSGDGIGLSQVLNQGSLLFVDTFVMNRTPQSEPFLHGATYISAFVGLSPAYLLENPRTLTTWLVQAYNPGARGGYGFSLTAEAYLNFGLVGIPVIFATLAGLQRFLIARIERSHFYPYASMVFTVSLMYGFRGESSTLYRVLTYACIFFVLIQVLSTRAWPRSPKGHVASGYAQISSDRLDCRDSR